MQPRQEEWMEQSGEYGKHICQELVILSPKKYFINIKIIIPTTYFRMQMLKWLKSGLQITVKKPTSMISLIITIQIRLRHYHMLPWICDQIYCPIVSSLERMVYKIPCSHTVENIMWCSTNFVPKLFSLIEMMKKTFHDIFVHFDLVLPPKLGEIQWFGISGAAEPCRLGTMWSR